MTTTPNTTFFATPQAPGFGREPVAADERLHHEENKATQSSAATETQYFSISIPEHDIRGICYLWFHASLGVITGGLNVWKGSPAGALASELFDIRQYGDAAPFEGGDLDGFRLANGYEVRIDEPFESIHVTYSDPARQNELDLHLTAVTPPIMAPSSHHFDQIMKTSGRLTLRGETYEIDSYATRDRSWGESRSEEPRAVPPAHYLGGAFTGDDDLAFIVQGFETPSARPFWHAEFPSFTDEQAKAATRGWVFRKGTKRGIEELYIETEFDEQSPYQKSHVLHLVDDTGEEYHLTGEVSTVNQWSAWTNVAVPIGHVTWTWGDRQGWGESQVVLWTDSRFALEQRLSR
jgi:hypothetical protein